MKTFLKKRPRSAALKALAAAAILLVLTAAAAKLGGFLKEKNERAELLDASGEEKILAFIERSGLKTAEKPERIEQKRIPPVFNEAYERYNEVMKTQGFDLNFYRGEPAEIRRYALVDPPAGYEGGQLVLIIAEGRIAAAAIEFSDGGGRVASLDLAAQWRSFEALKEP